jgi:regulator of sirC expression with transglutaminase-like and TPR domain
LRGTKRVLRNDRGCDLAARRLNSRFSRRRARARSAHTLSRTGSPPHLGGMDTQIIQLGLLDDEDIELDTAALALARLDHPGVDLAPYESILDAMVTRLAAIGGAAAEAGTRAALLAQVLAGEHGFAGDRESYDDPANADLIRVIERRRGLPVALSILYVATARHVGWSAEALDVPGHVLVLIVDDEAPVIVDPFRGGATVDAQQLARLVAVGAGEGQPVPREVAAMPNRAILSRLLRNQATRAETAGDRRRALSLYTRMTIFAPDQGHGWWERARLELADGDIPAARASLSAMLETTRDPTVRARVTQTLTALAGA